MAQRGVCRARFRLQRGDTHPPHQPLHPLAVDQMPLGPQQLFHPARAEKRPSRVELVDPTHQRQFVVVGRARLPIDAGTRHPKQRTLTADRRRRRAPGGPTRSSAGLLGQKIALHRQLPDLGVQLLNLALPLGLGIPADPQWSKARAACSCNCFFQA